MMIASLMMWVATAQSAAEPTFKTRGAFFAASVADLEASIRWYSEKLGMQVALRPPVYNGVSTALLQGGGLEVELIHDPAAVPLNKAVPAIGSETRLHGIFKAGVHVEDWDRLLAALKTRGVPIAIGPFPARGEQRANLIIRDNEGNYIQFFGDYAN